MTEELTAWTVGHSNHDFDRFAELLATQGIQVVVDVRSYPYSRFAPQFNQEELQGALSAIGVRYLFLGDELGGRPGHEEHYDADGHALYGLMADEPEFEQAINRVVSGARKYRVALVCSEGDPTHCHRRLLVGKVLADRHGLQLRHILPDGSIRAETTVDLSNGQQPTLFGDTEQPWRSTQSVSHRRRLSASSHD